MDSRVPSTRSSAPDKGEFSVQWYAVAFVDLLGASNAFEGLDDAFHPGLDKTEVVAAVHRAIWPISWLRTAFEDDFVREPGPELRLESSKRLSDSEQQRLKRFLETEIVFQAFSDCLLLSVPLAESGRHVPIQSVETLMGGCAALAPTVMASGPEMHEGAAVALRGAVELGVGTEYFPGEVMSAGLVRSHALEQGVARWPRVVVGARLLEYLQAHAGLRGSGQEDKFMREMAGRALSIVAEDDDGVPFLHYLAPVLRERLGSSYEFVLRHACRFALAEQKRLSGMGRQRQAEKYKQVVEYYRVEAPDIAAITLTYGAHDSMEAGDARGSESPP